MTDENNRCRICSNEEGNSTHIAKEMVMGFRDEFAYLECGSCGAVQLKDIPEDMNKYYSSDYYSFKKRRKRNILRDNPLKNFLARQRTKSALGESNPVGDFLNKSYNYNGILNHIKRTTSDVDSKILDLGSGASARYLLKLKREGFTNLQGADPFLEEDNTVEGIKLFKKDISEITDSFDIIVINHTFEHITNPREVLKETFRVLNHGGFTAITIPIASSVVWREYGVYWTGVHAPQHITLHTLKSMGILLGETDFNHKETIFESAGSQFWGSELVKKGISVAETKADRNIVNKHFSNDELKAFDEKARIADKNNEGDTATFYLQKPPV